MKAELHQECNYINEAECQRTFKKMIEEHEFNEHFYVPSIIDDLSTRHIITQEFIYGIPIDEVSSLPQETRDRVGNNLLSLCMHELFNFKFMQTDPNPANFYYDLDS